MPNLYEIYKCNVCGNMTEVLHGGKAEMFCCGKPMVNQIPATVEAAVEKHIPVIEKIEGGYKVKVGEVEHPMEKDHYIMWIAQVSDNQTTRIRLFPEQAAEVRFKYIPKSTIYAYTVSATTRAP